jgi:hypothetical protein
MRPAGERTRQLLGRRVVAKSVDGRAKPGQDEGLRRTGKEAYP